MAHVLNIQAQTKLDIKEILRLILENVKWITKNGGQIYHDLPEDYSLTHLILEL